MNNTARFLAALFLILFCPAASAQSINGFYVETRLGYVSEWLDSSPNPANTGFQGQWLNIRIDGGITGGLTYSYRQRLNKNTSRSFFDATDWIHIDWQAAERLSLSAGKQVVAIGGYEYDRAPIDLYYCSEFWNNIPCYQFGVSAGYKLTAADALLFQLCNSPFREWVGGGSYAYNLMWQGSHGFWETMWSANLMDISAGRRISYIALGNRLNLTDRLHLDLDFMIRNSSGSAFASDCSLMSELSATPAEGVRAFAKYTRDWNDSGSPDDYLVLDGTDISMISTGLEYVPAGAPTLKFFATGSYGRGANSNPTGTRLDRQLCCQLGVKWRMDILKSIGSGGAGD